MLLPHDRARIGERGSPHYKESAWRMSRIIAITLRHSGVPSRCKHHCCAHPNSRAIFALECKSGSLAGILQCDYQQLIACLFAMDALIHHGLEAVVPPVSTFEDVVGILPAPLQEQPRSALLTNASPTGLADSAVLIKEIAWCVSLAHHALCLAASELQRRDANFAEANRRQARESLAVELSKEQLDVKQFVDDSTAFSIPTGAAAETELKRLFTEVAQAGLTPPPPPADQMAGDDAAGVLDPPAVLLDTYGRERSSLVSPALALAWVLLPPCAQAAAYALFVGIHATSVPTFKAARKAVSEAAATGPARYVALFERLKDSFAAHNFVDGVGNNSLPRQRNRALILAVAAANLVACILPTGVLAAPEDQQPAPPSWLLVHQAIKHHSDLHAGATAWNLLTPGAKATAVRGKADQGVKYLLQQFSIKDSAYKIPVDTAPQQVWQDWFDKLSEITVHYDISDDQIIHTCTGHLSNNDRVLYGWADTVASLRVARLPVTLAAFFDHIRKQLFVRTDTRQTALKELRDLPADVASIVDCHTLVTTLKQIWLRLFPAQSDEREPIPRYEACLIIHELLIYIKSLGFRQRKTVLHRAWHEFDFRSTDLFVAHLRETSHDTTVHSEQACAAYLTAIFDNLQAAQEMYNRVHVSGSALQKPKKAEILALAASELGVSQQVLTNLPSSRAGASSSAKRHRSPTHKSKRDDKRSKSSAPAAAPTAAAAPSNFDKERLERERPAGQRFDALCSLVGISKSLQACLADFRERKCVLCGADNHTKGAVSCPKVQAAGKQAEVLAWQKSRRYAGKLLLNKGITAALAKSAK